MTEKEIENKAEEYAEITYFKNHGWVNEKRNEKETHKFIYIDGYKDGYEQGKKNTEERIFNEWCKGESPYPNACGFLINLQKENEKLKALLEKMRNCENCQTVTDVNGVCYISSECKNHSKWVLKNN